MSVEQGMPQVSGPLVNPDGTVSQAWWAFFRSLWVRTGSGSGISAADLEILLTLAQVRGLPQDAGARAEALMAALLALRRARQAVDYTTPELFALARPKANPKPNDDAKLFALMLLAGRRTVTAPLSTTVASLPSAATSGAGARAFVTDANATTFLSTVAGGGANKVPVVSDGSNWLIG